MNLHPPGRSLRPAPWAIALAFAIVYLAWGTTYIAIRVGVRHFPPALFGGTRVALAGLILLAYLKWRGTSLRLARRDLLGVALIGLIFFMGGNYLVTVGEKYVASGVAAILVATTPLWTALLETLWPGGEKLTLCGWLGLLVGLGGVFLLKLDQTTDGETSLGAILVVGSALAWAAGSCLLRRHRQRCAHLVAAAYQMLVGGVAQVLVGLALGEVQEVTPERFTLEGIYAFFHLLVVGSLAGFVAYNWLLGHVPTSQASTYAYVNPAVAIFVGWLLGDQPITFSIVAGLLVILIGVALVRSPKVIRGPWSVIRIPKNEEKGPTYLSRPTPDEV